MYGDGTNKSAVDGGLAETHGNRMERLGKFFSQFKNDKEKKPTVWDTMSDAELMELVGTTELDEYGVPKVGGYYNADGQRISGETLEAYKAPNQGFLKNIYNKMMPFDKFDFKDIYRQPAFGMEGYIMNGKATNYPITRSYNDGYGMN